jgi:putative SOS response-associated peptidase YedK
MCYNYEALVKRGIKRAAHEHGSVELTDYEKAVLDIEEPATPQSSFPGAEVQVLLGPERKPDYYLFGFLPPWAKAFNDSRKNFNARTDSIRIKPTWKGAWSKGQRCLVCASGFYEDDKLNKTRYFFSVKDEPQIYFAGIYNHWVDRETAQIFKTFAIVTTDPNELVATIHPRMPVILDKEGQLAWLKPQASDEMVFNLLKPFPASLMEMKESPKPPRKKKMNDEGQLTMDN